MIFVQYIEEKMIPVLAERGVSPIKFNFSALNEFLNNDFIRYFTKDALFEEFVLCRGYSDCELIVKRKDGTHHKIGYIDGDISEIPEWCGQKIVVASKKSLII